MEDAIEWQWVAAAAASFPCSSRCLHLNAFARGLPVWSVGRSSQSDEVRREREGFFGQLQRTATGFLSMARKALSMVILLASNSKLCAAGFMRSVN